MALAAGIRHGAGWSLSTGRRVAAGAALHAHSLHQSERITTDGRLVMQQHRLEHIEVDAPQGQTRPNQDGSVIISSSSSSSSSSRMPSLAAAAPVAPAISPHQLEQLVSIIQDSRKVVVLTGAGVSTESNIPDYRGPGGAYTSGFKPMTHQQFMAAPENRARYWARSFAGWHEFASARPNAAHEALARLQRQGWLGPIITQNVDRLHHKAGSSNVLEIHGTTHRHESCRHELQLLLARLNPEAALQAQRRAEQHSQHGAWERALKAGTAADARKVAGSQAEQVPVRRPDGDVELRDAGHSFVVPPCSKCGGILKPAVVFFGDSVPPHRGEAALQLCHEPGTLLVVGSSLMVYSAFRLAKAAKAAGSKLAVLSVGATRADDMVDLKLEVLAGEALMALASQPSMLLPRV